MTKEELLLAAKSLHYTEKLALAQSLIQQARQDLEQITSQLHPCAAADIVKQTSTATKSDTPQIEQAAPLKETPAELSLDDIVARLRKLNCKKEKTMMNSIAAMYQFRGGISETDVKKIILKMSMQKIISISETGAITWK